MGGVDELRVKFSYAKLQVGIWAIMKVFISQIHSWPPAGCPVLGDSAASEADTITAFQELREQRTHGRSSLTFETSDVF